VDHRGHHQCLSGHASTNERRMVAHPTLHDENESEDDEGDESAMGTDQGGMSVPVPVPVPVHAVTGFHHVVFPWSAGRVHPAIDRIEFDSLVWRQPYDYSLDEHGG